MYCQLTEFQLSSFIVAKTPSLSPKFDTQIRRLPVSLSRGVVFQIQISPRIAVGYYAKKYKRWHGQMYLLILYRCIASRNRFVNRSLHRFKKQVCEPIVSLHRFKKQVSELIVSLHRQEIRPIVSLHRRENHIIQKFVSLHR